MRAGAREQKAGNRPRTESAESKNDRKEGGKQAPHKQRNREERREGRLESRAIPQYVDARTPKVNKGLDDSPEPKKKNTGTTHH